MRQGQYFLVKFLLFYSVYLEVQKPIQNRGGWHGIIENKAISAFNEVEVEVKAEFGKIMMNLNWFLFLYVQIK